MDPKKKQLLISTSESFEKISRFLGMNLSSYIGRLYSVVLVILVISLCGISWRYICIDNCKDRFIIKFMVTLWICLLILLLLTILSTSLFRPKQFAFPRQEMFIIDSILESYGARFTDKDIFLIKHLQDIVAAIMTLLDLMKSFYDIMMNNLYQEICLRFFFWYGRMCILIMDGLFSHQINDIYLRFRELNKITIQHSRENLSISHIDFTASSNSFNKCNNPVITKIRSIQHIHHGLYILATKINTNFGVPLLIMSVISLNAIIVLLYEIYKYMETDNNGFKIADDVYVLFFYALRFLYISYICQRSRNEFKQMAIILHDAFLEYKSLRAEVVQFSLQLVHENLTFTALGLYEIDTPLICSIAGAIITYLVMVIQLDAKLMFDANNTPISNVTTTSKMILQSSTVT